MQELKNLNFLAEFQNLKSNLAPKVKEKLTSGFEFGDDILSLLPWDKIPVRFGIFILSGEVLKFAFFTVSIKLFFFFFLFPIYIIKP